MWMGKDTYTVKITRWNELSAKGQKEKYAVRDQKKR